MIEKESRRTRLLGKRKRKAMAQKGAR